MSLKQKAIGGVIWTVVDTFILRGLSFVATILLARWLGPEEFGLVGMVAVFVAIGSSITDSGMTASLIRSKTTDTKDFSTVFILNLLLSLSVYIVLFIAAPYIALFFKQPILTEIVRVYCFSFIIAAFSAVQLARLNKDMQFKKLAKLNIPGILIGVSVGLLLGFYKYGVWAIVWMHLTTQLVQSVMLWVSTDWKPKMQYSKEKARFHFGFGYKLMLSGLLDTVFQNIYNIVIGRYYSPTQLGYFERSKAFNSYPVTVLTSVISKVTYPLLSEIQNEPERISRVYRKLLQVTFFITAGLMFGAAAVAKPLFLLVLGEQWLPAVPYFQILSLASMFYPIHAFNLNVFKVYGRSDLFLKLELIKKTIIAIGLFVGFQFGILGLVWSTVATNYLALFINTYYSATMIHYSSKRQFMDMLPTFLIAGSMGACIYYLLGFLDTIAVFYQVLFGGLVGMFLYLGINKLFKTQPLEYLITLIKENLYHDTSN